MHEITIAAVALNNRDYPDLRAKLNEACQWVELAARQGADLVVLPELLNQYCGDGQGSTSGVSIEQYALDDWSGACAPLLDVASKHCVAMTVPVLVRESDYFINMFYFVSEHGEVLGRYQKRVLSEGELDEGVQPGAVEPLIQWRGVKFGGAICFDCFHEHVFADQVKAGADAFLIPSLTPGGVCLDYYALRYSTPIVLAYPAWSRIIDADGTELASGGYRHETLRFGFGSPLVTATINFDRVVLFGNVNQQKILDIQRKYAGRVGVRFDQANVVFMLESCDADLSVAQIVDEFGLISRSDYFAKSAAP